MRYKKKDQSQPLSTVTTSGVNQPTSKITTSEEVPCQGKQTETAEVQTGLRLKIVREKCSIMLLMLIGVVRM